MLLLLLCGHLGREGQRARPARRSIDHRLRRLDRLLVSRSRRDPRDRHPVRVSVCPARRADQAPARQRHGAVPGGVLAGEPGRARVRVQAAGGPQVSQRRPPHGRGREVQLPPLPGRLGQATARAGEGGGGHRSVPRAFRAACALAGLPGVLRHPGHRCRLDRAQEVHREGRRGRLQATTHGARTLPVREHEPRRGVDARGERAVLAQEAGDQARRHQGRPRPHDASGDAEDRRGRHRLPDGRPRSGDHQGGS